LLPLTYKSSFTGHLEQTTHLSS